MNTQEYTLIEKIQIVYPDTQWIMTHNDYDLLEFLDETKKLSLKDFEEKFLMLLPVFLENKDTEEANKAAARQSALEKLAAIGLTPDEITALTGGN